MQLILVDLDCFVSSFTKPWGFPFEFWYFLLSSVVWSQSYQKPGFPGGWLSGGESICQRRRHGCDPRSGPRRGAIKPMRHNTESVLWCLGAATTEAHTRYSLFFPRREAAAAQSPCPHEEQLPLAAARGQPEQQWGLSTAKKKKRKLPEAYIVKKSFLWIFLKILSFVKASEQTNNCLYKRQKTENGMVKDLITTDKGIWLCLWHIVY